MASETTTKTDFQIYNPEYHSGQIEGLAQNLAVFNTESQNTLQFRSRRVFGEYEKWSIFPWNDGLISRRDPTNVNSVDSQKVEQSEMVAVKLNRRMGPVETTLDAWRKIGSNWNEISYIFGRQTGQSKMQDALTIQLASLAAALTKTADVVHDGTAGTINHSILAAGMGLMGDRFGNIAAWVMHSKVYFDLVGQAISDKIYNVANTVIYGGSPGTLGKPVIVTDAAALYTDPASGDSGARIYNTFGLVSGACVIEETEIEEVVSDLITGHDNLLGRVQGEYALNLSVKGFAYNTGGGTNPTESTLGNSSNWLQIASNLKDGPGVVIQTR